MQFLTVSSIYLQRSKSLHSLFVYHLLSLVQKCVHSGVISDKIHVTVGCVVFSGKIARAESSVYFSGASLIYSVCLQLVCARAEICVYSDGDGREVIACTCWCVVFIHIYQFIYSLLFSVG